MNKNKLYKITVSYYYGKGGRLMFSIMGPAPSQKELDDHMKTKEYKDSVK